MAGTLIENLSIWKFGILANFLVLCQLACFFVGALIAPEPGSSYSPINIYSPYTTYTNVKTGTILGAACKDTKTVTNNTSEWFYNRGWGSCKTVSVEATHDFMSHENIAFAFVLPIPREGKILDYTSVHRNLENLEVNIKMPEVDWRLQMGRGKSIRYNTVYNRYRHHFRQEVDVVNHTLELQEYRRYIERGDINCDIMVERYGYQYICSAAIPIIEFGFLFSDFNIHRVQVESMDSNYFSKLQDSQIYVCKREISRLIQGLLYFKTAFFPCIVAILVWFGRRIYALSQTPVLLQKMLLSLGIVLCFLNLPTEYLSFGLDMPFLLFGDIRQGAFYITLFLFWLVFIREHMLIEDESSESYFKQYRRYSIAIGIGFILLFIIYICERFLQLHNPFHTIWATGIGTAFALIYIFVLIISTGAYFLFLCCMSWQVYPNMYQKRTKSLTIGSVGQFHSEETVYRFIFIILVTLICASLTVIRFIFGVIVEGRWKRWHDDFELGYGSAFFIGVYGMWNIYIFTLMVLYAPNHKRCPEVENITDKKILLPSSEKNKSQIVPIHCKKLSKLLVFSHPVHTNDLP